LNKKKVDQPTLFDTHRFHAFFTTSTLDTVTADKTHRAHAGIELVNADVKNSALAHLPSRVFTANAAWLVLAVITFNLTRAAATVAGNGLAVPPPRRSAANWSASPHESPPQRGDSPCACPRTGPGKNPGPPFSTTSSGTSNPPPPDQPADIGANLTKSGTPGIEARFSIAPETAKHAQIKLGRPPQVDRWIEA